MGSTSDKTKKIECLVDDSKHQSKENVDNSAKVVLDEKGTSNSRIYVSHTNVGKAKELMRAVKSESQTLDDIEKNGFKFSYDDENLPTKFKELFGKDGVMDLLADALMTKDKTSTKVYSFADMRNELKGYYKNLKFETFKSGIELNGDSMKTIVTLSKEMKEILEEYMLKMDDCLRKLERIYKKSKAIADVTKIIKLAAAVISLLGSLIAQPEIAAVGTVVSVISSFVSFSNELYLRVKVKSIKGVIKQYQSDINNKYKQIKAEYIKLLSNGQDTTNKTLIIKRYNTKSLEEFNQRCKNASNKYQVKVNRFKFWSKDLNKQKKIFKGGISNLMK